MKRKIISINIIMVQSRKRMNRKQKGGDLEHFTRGAFLTQPLSNPNEKQTKEQLNAAINKNRTKLDELETESGKAEFISTLTKRKHNEINNKISKYFIYLLDFDQGTYSISSDRNIYEDWGEASQKKFVEDEQLKKKLMKDIFTDFKKIRSLTIHFKKESYKTLRKEIKDYVKNEGTDKLVNKYNEHKGVGEIYDYYMDDNFKKECEILYNDKIWEYENELKKFEKELSDLEKSSSSQKNVEQPQAGGKKNRKTKGGKKTAKKGKKSYKKKSTRRRRH